MEPKNYTMSKQGKQKPTDEVKVLGNKTGEKRRNSWKQSLAMRFTKLFGNSLQFTARRLEPIDWSTDIKNENKLKDVHIVDLKA